ncbi:MAG: surface-adhesin E family protein [Dissulfurispiraceae bacterium]|jgi:hypothetical protein
MASNKSLSAVVNVFIAVILVAGVWCSVSAEAAEWKPYAADRHFSYFYDAKRVSYPYKTIYDVMHLELAKLDIINVWTKRMIRDEKDREWQIRERYKLGLTVKGYERYNYTVSRKEVDCSGKKYRVLLEADYSKEGDELSLFLKGANVGEWALIPPGSDTEALYRAICERAKTKDPEPKDEQREDQ